MRFLKKSTAVTIVIGPLRDWADGKTLLIDNDTFDPANLHCELIKGSTSSALTLAKTGVDNNINLTGYGMATLTLTATDTATAGQLRIGIINAVVDEYSTDYILPIVEDFTILHADAYDALIAGDLSETDGVAASLWQKINQVWRRFFKKCTCSDTELKTFKDDGTSVNTTQAVSDSGSIETVGAAS